MKRIAIVVGAVMMLAGLAGCDKGTGGEMSAEHQALIKEFEGYQAEQCACKDFECTKAVGQKVGPRVQAVMGADSKLPKQVQLKVGMMLEKMTACAKATRP